MVKDNRCRETIVTVNLRTAVVPLVTSSTFHRMLFQPFGVEKEQLTNKCCKWKSC